MDIEVMTVEGSCIGFDIKLKTGFFEAKLYTVLVTMDAITFTSEEKTESFTLDKASIHRIGFIEGYPRELEIQTDKEVFMGTIANALDTTIVYSMFKIIFGKKFVQW